MAQKLIAGVDEAGRGPLAGPVFAAAVILNPLEPIFGLTDSKKLSAKKREEIFALIQKHALAWAVGRAEVEEIDSINILQASLLAMQRAILTLKIIPEHILIDGNVCPNINLSHEAVIHGDVLVPAISAASIVAKVLRDQEMVKLDKLFPQYNFAKHKGYGTKEHLAALAKYGPCEMHRKSFSYGEI